MNTEQITRLDAEGDALQATAEAIKNSPLPKARLQERVRQYRSRLLGALEAELNRI